MKLPFKFHWNKNVTIGTAVVLLVLLAAFFWTGNGFQWGGKTPQEAPVSAMEDGEAIPTASPEMTTAPQETPQPSQKPESSPAPTMKIDPATGTDAYQTQPVPTGKPVPVEPQDTEVTDQKMTVTLSIRCDTLLGQMQRLNPDKRELVPENGLLLKPTVVTFYEGESVFNVLQRETKRNKIHMEFVNTPLYNSSYIEGIGNLYELDCGELSGWMYRINGWFPNYGCSRYQLQDGDVIEWVYTCDLGRDVGSDLGGFQR